MSKMTKTQRWVWLLREGRDNGALEITDTDLVKDFLRNTGAATRRVLGDDLRDMNSQGLLERTRRGLGSGPGVAKWVFTYTLASAARRYLEKHTEESHA